MSDHETPSTPEAMRDRNRRVFEGLSGAPFTEVLTDPANDEFIATLNRHILLSGMPTGFMFWYYPDPAATDYCQPEKQSFGVYHTFDMIYGQSQAIALAGVRLADYQRYARRMRERNHPIITLLPEDIRPDFLRAGN